MRALRPSRSVPVAPGVPGLLSRALRPLLTTLIGAGILVILAPAASANQSNFTANLTRYSGQDQQSLSCGTMTAAFGFNGEAHSWDVYRQWAWGTWSPGVTFPAGATVLDATVSGSAAEGGPWVAPAQSVGLSLIAGQTAAMEGNGAGNCQFGYGTASYGSVNVPGNTSSVSFRFDAYGLAQTYVADGSGPWWDYGADDVALGAWDNFQEIWMVPTSALVMSVEYAFVPSGLGVAQVDAGKGTQTVISWNPNGNGPGTTYTLQRQTVTAAGPQAWSTVYQGTATSFQTADQDCGRGYVYRVAVLGAHAQTAWDQSAEWDEYPCTVQVAAPSGSTDSVNIAWPEVAPTARYAVIWCVSNECNQQQWNTGNATSAQLVGLQPNTPYTIWVCSVDNRRGCPVAATWTYAAVPTLHANNTTAGLAYDQQPLVWDANSNPTGTMYELQQGTYAVSGAWQGGAIIYSGTATAFTANQSVGTAYAYNVWAISSGYGSGTAASNPIDTEVSATPTLTVTGATSAQVSWAPVAHVTATWVGCEHWNDGVWVTEGTAMGGATSLSFGGMTPNTPYYCAITPTADNQGIQWWQGTAHAYTAAAVPTPGRNDVTQTTLEATWGAGGNPPGTIYQVVLDEDGTNWMQHATTTGTSFTFGNVRPGLPAWVYVQALGVEGSPTPQGQDPTTPDSAWMDNGAATLVPAEPTITASDGGLGWAPGSGRGYVTLRWPPSPGATGYSLYVWDGAAYEGFDLGDATSWDSRAAGIYPTDESLYPNVTIGSKALPLFAHNGGGLNLRDRPIDLYCSAGAAYCTQAPTENYWFTVAAYNSAGSSATYQVPGSPAASYAEPTLPLQSDPAAPTIAVWSLNHGGAYTYARAVDYSITAAEDTSGIAAYALSNDGSTWQTTSVPGCVVGQVAACKSALATTGTWMLLPGPGSKSVWARVESAAGVWSPPQATTVYVNVDQTVPTVDVVLDGGAASTTSSTVMVGVTVSDPVSLENGGLTWQARYSTDGGQTWSAWQAEGGSDHWSVSWPIPTGPGGERAVLVQVRNSDNNLGQGGSTIAYVSADIGGSATLPTGDGGGGRACTWPVNGTSIDAVCVTSSQVTLPLQAPAGAAEMRASRDDVTWGPWRAVAGNLALDLGSSPGAKTVWIQYRDTQGAVTADAPVYYVYDPGPPSVQASWLGNASATNGNGGAVLQVQAADDVGSGGMTLTVTENGATLYDGPCRNNLPLVLTGAGYQIVQARVTDVAGGATETQIGIYVEQESG